jgi:hypothetical protein
LQNRSIGCSTGFVEGQAGTGLYVGNRCSTIPSAGSGCLQLASSVLRTNLVTYSDMLESLVEDFKLAYAHTLIVDIAGGWDSNI